MRTLVTGGAGFIGASLVERLLAEGHTVDVVDNLSTGSLTHLGEARAGAGRDLTFHQLDVRSPDVADLISRRRPEVVWHLAAETAASALADAQVNVIGALGVLDGARAAESRKLVVASSASVYGDLDGRGRATEREGRRPTSFEGVAKHTVDAYLAADGSVRFTSVVLSTVYGPRAVGGVIAQWTERLRAGRPCTVFGDGGQSRDFVFVDDVVDALARAADSADGAYVNVSTGVGTTVVDLHAAMVAIGRELGVVGDVPPLRHVPARPGEAYRVVLDPSRAAEVLGWSARVELEQGLRHTYTELIAGFESEERVAG